MTRTGARPLAAWVVGAALLGTLAGTVAHNTPWAQAYWTDTATVTSGPFTTWALTNVSCPNPAWGSNADLKWQVPSGSSATVSIALDPTSPPVTGLSYWSTSLAPGSPLTTTGDEATWGVGSNNLWESAQFDGTWSLVVTSPGGAWTATSTGTWSVHYANSTATCTVDPVSGP
ncbi:MAG: hypothetical protein FWF02_02220 [Micrococcales bacterium]|nr:hypothetical protein [Micrococcales bacterium]MCL2666507.1 hypothetical protein [Micrococcales bacterium]